MPISVLLSELWLLRTYALDFYPREFDIRKALGMQPTDPTQDSSAEVFADDGKVSQIADYVAGQIQEATKVILDAYGEQVPKEAFRIPAVATFFPDLVSREERLADQAGEALAGAIRLAAALGAGVVEFVLGRTVERCHNSPANLGEHTGPRCDYVYESDPVIAIKRAVAVLKKHACPVARDLGIRLAAEIEPGFSYVLNSRSTIDAFLSELNNRSINDCVGLNLDIGHLIILSHTTKPLNRITPNIARHWKKSIFHAHISDNIGHHYGDLVPGVLHDLYAADDEEAFDKWVKFCWECAKDNEMFTGYLAVELEGCSRIQWIQRSLLRLGYLIRQSCR